MQTINNTLNHFEKLQALGIKTFGEKLWNSEIHLLKALLRGTHE